MSIFNSGLNRYQPYFSLPPWILYAQAFSVDIGSLDFIISDAGAMIWHVIVEAGEGGTATMECDEDYEKHIDFRWDAHVAKQVWLLACSHEIEDQKNFSY